MTYIPGDIPEPVPATNQAGEVALRAQMYGILRGWNISEFASRVCSAKGHGALPADICEAELDAFGEAFITALATQPATSQEGEVLKLIKRLNIWSLYSYHESHQEQARALFAEAAATLATFATPVTRTYADDREQAREVLAAVIGWRQPLTGDIAAHITVSQCVEAMQRYAHQRAAALPGPTADELEAAGKAPWHGEQPIEGHAKQWRGRPWVPLEAAISELQFWQRRDYEHGRSAALATQPATSQEGEDADRANGVGQDELVAGLKRALQHPAGDHDGWTDAGMEHAFFRWPVIVNALNEALAATPTPPAATSQEGEEDYDPNREPGNVVIIPSMDAATPTPHLTTRQEKDYHGARHLLLNLLATIHRDGGQYVDAHGEFKATEDAVQIVASLLAATPTPPTLSEDLREAIVGIADDYMTSEAHHPGHVLIPVERFERLAALPGAKS